MGRGRRKALDRTKELLRERHEEAEVQCEALIGGKSLAFNEIKCIEKENAT